MDRPGWASRRGHHPSRTPSRHRGPPCRRPATAAQAPGPSPSGPSLPPRLRSSARASVIVPNTRAQRMHHHPTRATPRTSRGAGRRLDRAARAAIIVQWEITAGGGASACACRRVVRPRRLLGRVERAQPAARANGRVANLGGPPAPRPLPHAAVRLVLPLGYDGLLVGARAARLLGQATQAWARQATSDRQTDERKAATPLQHRSSKAATMRQDRCWGMATELTNEDAARQAQSRWVKGTPCNKAVGVKGIPCNKGPTSQCAGLSCELACSSPSPLMRTCTQSKECQGSVRHTGPPSGQIRS
jgi:hypothetical protein